MAFTSRSASRPVASASPRKRIRKPERVVIRRSVVGDLVVELYARTLDITDESHGFVFLNAEIRRIQGKPMTDTDEALAQRIVDDIHGLAASWCKPREVVA
jgi:hypothetical protein